MEHPHIGIDYSIKTEVFEGPLELLLSLIEKRKLLINDISLQSVTDDYIEHVKRLETFPVAQTAQFILVASTLLLLKSKSLLPTLELSQEEQESIEDLEERLKTYKRIQELSQHVKRQFGTRMLYGKPPTPQEPIFSPDRTLSSSTLLERVKNVLAHLPTEVKLPETVVKKMLTLEDTVLRLTERISESFRMNFTEFANVRKEERATVIVSFLAMLELVKQGVLSVKQEGAFQEIEMESQNVQVPKYT